MKNKKHLLQMIRAAAFLLLLFLVTGDGANVTTVSDMQYLFFLGCVIDIL